MIFCVDKFVVDDIVIIGGEKMSSGSDISPEEADRIIEIFGQSAEDTGGGKKIFKPIVQKFPFSPELRIAELERKNAVLEQTVKELQARTEEL